MDATNVDGFARDGGWLDAYYDLRAATYEVDGREKRLTWKQAAFAAWDNAPKPKRKPDTMLELAGLLNLRSEQVFYKWRKTEWYRQLGIDEIRRTIFEQHLADVDRKTIDAATNETGSAGVQARRLFYEEYARGRERQQADDVARDWWAAAVEDDGD